MTISEYWSAFKASIGNPDAVYCEATQFGYEEDADELAQLVLEGKKRGTTGSLLMYKLDNFPTPKPGVYTIVLNAANEPVAVIQTKKVTIKPFNKITEREAKIEGEGDGSLSYWRAAHLSYFSREYKEHNRIFDENEILVFEEFDLVWRNQN
jgi:uncharacterized protein YhfF